MTAPQEIAWQSERVSHADRLLAELYEAQWVRMVRLAGLLLRSSDHAEEVVQDAFVQIYRRAKRFETAGDAVGYLRTSVVNGVRSVQRHREVVHRRQPPPPAAPAGPEELAVRAAEDARVLGALHDLPQRQREVLVLRYWSDLPGAEIAEALGISEGSVKSHTHRGIAALRAALGDDQSDGKQSDGGQSDGRHGEADGEGVRR